MGIKKILAILTVVIATIAISSAPVSKDLAKSVADAWLLNHQEISAKGFTTETITAFTDANGTQLAWVTNLAPTGFIIIAADDLVSPILSYSTENPFSGNTDKNSPLSVLLQKDLSKRLSVVSQLTDTDKNKIAGQWKSYTSNAFVGMSNIAGVSTGTAALLPPPVALVPSVNPLLTTTWNQQPMLRNDPPSYNKLTPHNYPAGCGPVAMSQILKYHSYPPSALVSKLINTDFNAGEFNQLSYNDTFDYNLMPDSLTNTSTTAEIDEVAKLMRDTGIAMSAVYNFDGTSASDLNMTNCMIGAFQYKSATLLDTQATAWEPIVQSELSSKYPVIFSLFSSVDQYGHFVVCDGWGIDNTDQSTRYHLNMGWGGLDNNWYQMPTVTTSQFAFDQLPSIIYNIRPGNIVVVPSAPVLATPQDGTTVPSPVNLSWQSVVNAVSYNYEISTAADVSNPVVSSSTTLTNIVQATQLTAGTTYYWRVSATDQNAAVSPWSQVWSFTVQPTVQLPAPILTTPTDGATVSDPLTLTWQSVTNAANYSFAISTAADMSATQSAGTIPTTSHLVTLQMVPGTTYYWHVNAIDAGNNASPFSPIWRFVYQPTAQLVAPVPTTPTDAATVSGTVALGWQIVTNATGYNYEVSTNNTFTAPFETININNNSTLTANVQATLTDGVTYYWHIRSTGVGGTFSPWSTVMRFTYQTVAVIQAPTLLTPTNNATNIATPITIAWSPVTTATKYEYEIYSAASATVPIETLTVTTTSAVIKYTLLPGTRYTWQVRAIDSKDVNSAYSTLWAFTTQGLSTIGTPVITFPANNATNVITSPGLRWSAASNATLYHVEVSTNSTFTNLIINNQNVTTTSLQLTNLLNNTVYYWRVTGGDATPRWGSPASASFTTGANVTQKPSAPVLVTPANAATGVSLTPTLTWQAVTTAVSYTVEYANNSNFTNAVTATGTSLTANVTLNSNTRYYWRVLATDSTGTNSNWATAYFTTVNQVTTLTAPTLTAPANNATNVSANTTFTWTAVSNAVAYDVQLSTNVNFTVKVSYNTALTSQAALLANTTNYYWRARAKQGNTLGPWSATSTFTTGQFVSVSGLDAEIANSKVGSPSIGANIIDSTGQIEVLQIAQAINRQSEFYISIKNTGNVADNFIITSTSTINSKWTVKVFDISGIDRTRSVFSNGWASNSVKPGESVKIMMRYSANSGQVIDSSNPPTQSITIKAQSWKDLNAGAANPATDTITGIAVLTERSKIR